ncbi:OmpA family protein [Variovorax sp. GT1P44]|uniref:OmpA family protein n=1 Tax=Variovorax sp. GT1P44 TaxID=3443742 RepID=UPI003F46BAAD
MQSFKFLSLAQRTRVGQGVAAAALSVLCLLSAPSAFAQRASQPQGAAYSPVPPVVSQQAQVVFFRKPASGAAVATDPAHVYINGVFHTALKSDMFTRFCVPTGNYSIEAHIGDAPKFVGKARQATRVDLEGGKTYFVAVSENRTGEPTPVRRAEAEELLQRAVEQRHFVNRSGAIVACQEAPQPAKSEPVSFTLNADVLFDFARSDYASITSRGREELRKVAQQVRERSPNAVSRVTVRGHADPIGSAQSNMVLSEQRARTVARVLSEEGLAAERISIEGAGSEEPVVSCSMSGSRQARVDCNAPNRRVEIVVAGSAAA